MKKVLALLLLLCPVAVHAQLTTTEKVGEQTASDGGITLLRAERLGGQVTADDRAHYAESSSRGRVFMMDSDAITLASAHTTKGALGTVKFINGFWNPTTSKVNAEILWSSVVSSTFSISGAPFYFNFYCGVTVTSANTGTIRSALLSNGNGASQMVPQTNVIIVVSGGATTALNQLEALGGGQSISGGSIVAASVMPIESRTNVDGRITVPPGCLFGITSALAGTSHAVQSTLTWMETPL